MKSSSYERIWSVVRRIPRGRVATYGQIARIAGLPRQARMVGYALHALPDDIAASVPWQRVINAQGRISLRAFAGSGAVQRRLLLREGVKFDARARIDLDRFGWRSGSGSRASEARSTAEPREVRVARGRPRAGSRASEARSARVGQSRTAHPTGQPREVRVARGRPRAGSRRT